MQFLRNALVCAVGLALLVPSLSAAETTSYVPKDAQQVIYVNVKKMMTSKIIKKQVLPLLESVLKDSQEAQQFFKAIQLDPMKDLQEVFVTVAEDGNKVLVVMQADLKAKKIETVLNAWAKQEPKKITVEKVGARSLYTIVDDDKPTYASLLDEKTLAISQHKAYVTAAIQGKLGTASKGLQAAMKTADKKQAVWLAGIIPDTVKAMLKANEAAAQFANKITTFSGGAKATDDLGLSLEAHVTDKQTGQALKTVLMQLKPVLEFLAQSNEELAPAINDITKSLKINAEGKAVGVSFRLGDDALKTLIKMIQESQGEDE